MNDSHKEDKYFSLRNVTTKSNNYSGLPKFFKHIIPANKNCKILDIGCGFCVMLQNLRNAGYNNVSGIDISNEAIEYASKINIPVRKIESIVDFAQKSVGKYDFIILTHVLEHIDKNLIIGTLKAIREHLLLPGGKLYIAVPNAQSNTDCYWRYEDFTHTTLFTSGSLFYVLKASGFQKIDIMDPYSLEGRNLVIKMVVLFLLSLYKLNKKFWNKVTNSYYHAASPNIYSYELKIVAHNDHQ